MKVLWRHLLFQSKWKVRHWVLWGKCQNWQLKLATSRKAWMKKLTLLFSYFWLPDKELVFAQFCSLTRKGTRNRMERPSSDSSSRKLAFACLRFTSKCSFQNISTKIIKKESGRKKKRIRRPEKTVSRLSIWMVSWKFVFIQILQISMVDDLYLGEFEGK